MHAWAFPLAPWNFSSQKSSSPFLAWAITPCKEHPTYVVWTIHSAHQTQLEKNYHPSHPQENKGGPLHSMTQLLIGCMEIIFLKLASTIFWPELIPNPKVTFGH
jgi:hypothetical protein